MAVDRKWNARVIEEERQSTREPEATEWPAINAYVAGIEFHTNEPPLADHLVPGVGRVLFSRIPSDVQPTRTAGPSNPTMRTATGLTVDDLLSQGKNRKS